MRAARSPPYPSDRVRQTPDERSPPKCPAIQGLRTPNRTTWLSDGKAEASQAPPLSVHKTPPLNLQNDRRGGIGRATPVTVTPCPPRALACGVIALFHTQCAYRPDRFVPHIVDIADWRAGRNAVYQLAALTIGARLAVADG